MRRDRVSVEFDYAVFFRRVTVLVRSVGVDSGSRELLSTLALRCNVIVQSAMPYSFSALGQKPFIGDLNRSSVLVDNNESGVVEKGGGIVLVRPTPTQAIADLVEVFRSS